MFELRINNLIINTNYLNLITLPTNQQTNSLKPNN